MVEMSETANILNNATTRSLIILDEIGRGTSTFDGLSLAWSILEYLHNQVGAKTLFATHYHELTELAARLPRLRNFNVAVREWHDRIVFLRKIVPAARTKATASRSRGWPACRRRSWTARRKFCGTLRNRNSHRKATCGSGRANAPSARNCKSSARRRSWICSVD